MGPGRRCPGTSARFTTSPSSSPSVDRGFRDSIYFREPLGLLVEPAPYRFEPPHGRTRADVLRLAHGLRVERGGYNIAPVHLADANKELARP